MAQAAGRAKFGDNHPSPDYIGGFVQFANGVRGIYECGAGAPDQPEVGKWWGKNRIGAQGTEGFAEVLTNGGWRAVTKIRRLPDRRRRDELRPRHAALHPGNGRLAGRHAEGPPVQFRPRLLWAPRSCSPCSAARPKAARCALPLTAGADEQALLKAKLADRPVLVSCEQNKKEFGLA